MKGCYKMNKKKTKQNGTRVLAAIMSLIMLLGGVVGDKPMEVCAATTTQDHGFEIDESVYRVNWDETDKIKVKQDVRCWDGDFDKNKTLGYVKVYVGLATTKKPVDKKYYQRVLVWGEMVPLTVTGSKKGMSQYLTIKVQNAENMKNIKIEPTSTTGSTSYSTTGEFSKNKVVGVSIGNKEWEISKNGSHTMGLSSTTSYVEDALLVCTNKDDNGFGVWEYDYVSSKSKTQNNYLFGSSDVYGLYMWNMPENGNKVYSGLNVKVEASFGGGDKKNNERYKKLWSDIYTLGTDSKSFYIYI